MATISNEDLQALKSRAYNAVAAVQAQRQVVANLESKAEQWAQLHGLVVNLSANMGKALETIEDRLTVIEDKLRIT